MGLPIDVRDLLRSGSAIQKDREKPLRVVVIAEEDAPAALSEGIRDRLRPRTTQANVQTEMVESGTTIEVASTVDAVVAIAGTCGRDLLEALGGPRRLSIPIVVVATGLRVSDVADALLQPTEDVAVGADVEEALDDELAVWLADRLAHKRLALAHNFPFVRSAVAREAVAATAWQNGLIGAVAIIPGADMPLMTANQAKMVMQIAAAYGERLGPERIAELAAVVGGGFAARAVARQALAFVPGFGWAIKGGVGYAGTIAMGNAAIAYFEQGADLGEVTRRIGEVTKKASRQVRGRISERVGGMALPAGRDVSSAGATPQAVELDSEAQAAVE